MTINLFIFFVMTFVSLGLLNAILEGNTGLASTNLTATLSEDATTMSVQRTQGFTGSGVLVVGDEKLCFTGSTANTFTGLTRGQQCRSDSAAASHAAGQRVYSESPGVINVLVGFDIASAYSDGGLFGFVKGTVKSVANLPAFMQAVAKMIAWDYRFLDGEYVYVKYLLLYPLSAGMVLAFVRMGTGR